jgi:hypothetical protein
MSGFVAGDVAYVSSRAHCMCLLSSMFKTLPELFEVVEDLIETEGVDIAEHCRTRQCEPVHVAVRIRVRKVKPSPGRGR